MLAPRQLDVAAAGSHTPGKSQGAPASAPTIQVGMSSPPFGSVAVHLLEPQWRLAESG